MKNFNFCELRQLSEDQTERAFDYEKIVVISEEDYQRVISLSTLAITAYNSGDKYLHKTLMELIIKIIRPPLHLKRTT